MRNLSTGEDQPTLKEKFDKAMKEMDGLSPEQLQADPRFSPLFKAMKKVLGNG